MKQFILLMIGLASLSLFSCSEIDNYKAPDSRIEGKLLDATTGELIPSQGYNGARILLYDGNSVTSTTVWVHTDGTYRSERVFSGTYRIIPLGPFMVSTADTVKTNIPASGSVDFNLEPYLRVKLDEATLSGTTATVKFTITKSTKTTAILNEYAVVYANSENIDAASGFVSRQQIPANDGILDVQQTVTIENINTSRPVFVRIAARTGASGQYNYSTIKRLK